MSAGKYSPAIVVAAYNRVHSLQRLLRSLEQAIYPASPVRLVISIDGGGSEDVVNLAEQFNWTHGDKQIIRHSEHLGLKAHILRCGDLTAEYGSIILLEDDLLVSKYFHNYSLKCLAFYDDDNRIAGISLYSYDIAENGFHPFAPVNDGADAYFMQVASSWGQAWTGTQWKNFREWFEKHPVMTKEELPPAYLFNWHENSWKKHFVRYLHHAGRYFVFPRHSFSTNFEDPGDTADRKGLYQVPLAEGSREYFFPKFDDSKSVYDACFEIRADCLKKWCPRLNEYDFTVDTYGTLPIHNCKTPYLLTIRQAKDEVAAFSLEMFPPVLNVINEIKGNQIKLVKKENVLSEKVAADANYYKYKPVSEIIFQEELVHRIENVHALYSKKIDNIHKMYAEKIEGLNIEIRKLHQGYNQQIAGLHEDFAVKIESAVKQSLKDYQFNLDNPLFAVVTLAKPENLESTLLTMKSVMKQDYPRISHKVIMTGTAGGMNLSEFMTEEKCHFENVETIGAAWAAAESHLNHHESDCHVWLEPGTVLLPKAFLTVKEIFRRFAEVNWLKGLPVKIGSKGEFIPTASGMDFRWDNIRFYNSSLSDIANQFSAGGIFWKRHIWDRAGGKFNPAFPHIAGIEYWKILFEKDMLYIAFANLTAASENYVPSAEAADEFQKLKDSFPKRSALQQFADAAFYPFFKKDIPLLKTMHKSQRSYPPLVRFDYNSQSFYLSDY